MKYEIIKSLECKFVSGTYKFFYSDYSDPLENMKVIKPIIERVNKSIQSYLFLDDFAFEGLYYDDKDTICYVVPFCKHCNSFNVIRKDFNTRRVYNNYGKLVDLKLKRYECKDCGRKSQTELFNAYDSYSRIPNHVKEKIALGLHNGDKTLLQQVKDIKLFTNIPISRETARKCLFTDNEENYKKYDFELSGYSAYDAQWIPHKGKFVYRLSLIDSISYLPIAEAISEKEDKKTLKDFISKSIPAHKRIGIVTDSKSDYDSVFKELGFPYHQHCIFHLLQRINDLINTETNKFKRQYKNELKESNPEYSESKLKKLVNEEGKKYRKQFEVYHDEIKEIFEQETYNEAIAQVNKIIDKIEEYPEFLAEYLKKNFLPNYKKFIVFLKDEVKGKLEKTNNKCENYIGKILKKSRKGDFKTISGVFSYICHKVDGWIERQLEKLKKVG